MKMAGIDINNRETAAIDHGNWSSIVKADTKRAEDRRWTQLPERRDHRKQTSDNAAFSSLYRLCTSAADVIEPVTTKSDFLVTSGDTTEQKILTSEAKTIV